MSPIFFKFIKVFEPATTKRLSSPPRSLQAYQRRSSRISSRSPAIRPLGTERFRDEFVFFPYDSSGPTISTEEELAKRVPRYFERWLAPRKPRLVGRRGIDANRWWLLTWPRSWQFRKRPKLTSTYFGYRGSFAYDEAGEFVVLQGYAWLWKRKKFQGSPSFDESSLPWAYLAILNSPVFETLL